MWYMISVGGCGGMLYMTHNKYVKDLDGYLWNSYDEYKKGELNKGYNSISREKMLGLEPLFKGIKIDADEEDAKGEKFTAHVDKKIESYSVLERRERQKQKPYECDYYIYRGIPSELGKKVAMALGEDFIEKSGFAHSPELQMICLAINKIRDYIMDNIDKLPEIGVAKEGDGVLFLAGLGGGTGTGIIETIAKEIFGHRPIPSLALVVLSGKEDTSGQRPYCRRCFNLIWALNNLLTSKALDGVILVDNNVLNVNENIESEMAKIDSKEKGSDEKAKERKEWKKRHVIDQYIIKRIFPLFKISGSKAGIPNILSHFKDRLEEDLDFTPVLIPCYSRGKGSIEELIEEAINNGKLAECDPESADKIYAFIRNTTKGEVKEEELKKIFPEDKVEIFDVDSMGMNEDEVLVLLRNPDVNEILKERIEIAEDFAKLIREVGDKSGGEIKKARSIKVGEEGIRDLLQKLGEYGEGEKGIFERRERISYGELILDSAKEFLFPENEEKPYKYMKRLIDGFIEEIKNIKEREAKRIKPVFNSLIEFEGIEMYLFSIDAKASEELDLFFKKIPSGVEGLKELWDKKPLEKLKTIFEREGFPLSENPEINGDGWGELVIKDGGEKFIVRKEDGGLNVYSPEAEKERGIIKRAEIEKIIEEKIKSFKVDAIITETGQMGSMVSKPTPSGEFDSMLKDSEELKELNDKAEFLRKTIPPKDIEELREKVESLSSRSETLEAGEKLSTLYWLKQMTEINSISKDIEELKKIKEKVEPLGKTIPSKDFKKLKERVESLSSRSEPRHVEVSKLTPSEDINLRLKNIEEELKTVESLEEKKIGELSVEEEII